MLMFLRSSFLEILVNLIQTFQDDIFFAIHRNQTGNDTLIFFDSYLVRVQTARPGFSGRQASRIRID